MSNVDVAVWLGIKGGKDAEKQFQQFGRTGKASLNEIKEAARGLPPHLVAVSRGVAGLKDGVDDLAARTGTIGKVAASFGPWGLAAVAASAAIGLAAAATYGAARAAMQFGDAISDSAARYRVSTDTLQEMRYAIHAAGGEFEDADSAVQSFQQKLGAAEAGAKRSLQWFERLGFTQQQLKSFSTTDEALQAVTARVAGLAKESEAAAIAEKLGLTPLLPLLRKGADEMARLRDEAHQLGFVMDADVVEKLGDANDKFEAAAHIIDVQVKGAFAGLAVEIAASATRLAEFMARFKEFKASDAGKTFFQGMGEAQVFTPLGLAGAAARGVFPRAKDWSKFESPDRSFDVGTSGLGSLEDTDAAAAAKAAAKAAAAELDRYYKALASARQNLLAEDVAGAKVARTIEDRYDLQRSLLDLERKARESELDREVTDGGMTAAHAASLKQAEEQVRQGKLANMRLAERMELEDHRLAQEKALADLADELLSQALAGARTAGERQRLELLALEARRAVERHALEVSLGRDANLSPEERQRRLSGFDDSTAGQRSGVRRDTMGPLEQFRDTFLQTADEVDQALQGIAADGLATLSDGLVDAVRNAKSLGEVFSNVADQIVSGLMRIAIQQAIIKPFADMLGGGSGGGGIWDTIAKGIGSALGGGSTSADWAALGSTGASGSGAAWYSNLKGRASGGPFYRGDRRLVGEQGIERLAANSDGYVFDHAATARQMGAGRAAGAWGGAGSGGGPIAVNLNNASGTPLKATAVERQDSNGSRSLDIDLLGLIDSRADARVQEMTQGRRDDGALRANFGMRRNLSGS